MPRKQLRENLKLGVDPNLLNLLPKESTPISYAFNINPNPFVKQTRLDYALPKQSLVEVMIFDASGRKVTTLVSEMKEPGYYSHVWNGNDDKDRKVASGVYFIRMVTDDFKSRNKVIFLR